jgi:hypothetical protein
MAYVNPEYVYNLQKTHNAIFWKISDPSGKLIINSVTDSIPLSSSQELLQETLKECQGDYVLVKLYTYKPARIEKGDSLGQIFDLRVKLDNPGRILDTGKQHQPGIGLAEYTSAIKENNELQMAMYKMELEAKQNSPLARLAEKLMENDALVNILISAFIKAPVAAPAAVISAPTNNNPGKLDDAINNFSEVDPDYINTLNKMAAYIKQNPTVLGQIKNIIN